MKVAIGRIVRTEGTYNADSVSEATGLKCEDPSLAVQSQKDEADINTIVRNFGLTSMLPQGVRLPTYEDFTECVEDYGSALRAVMDAEREFMKLPANMRKELDNDPQRFLEFVNTPGNEAKLREWGLLPPAPPASGS